MDCYACGRELNWKRNLNTLYHFFFQRAECCDYVYFRNKDENFIINTKDEIFDDNSKRQN